MISANLDGQIVTRRLKVLVLEDVDYDRVWLRTVLERIPDVLWTGEAATVWQAKAKVLSDRPDLVFLDEWVPGELPVDWVPELLSQGVRWCWLSGRLQEAQVEGSRKVDMGCLGWIQKPQGGAQAGRDEEQRAIQEIQGVVKSALFLLNG